MKNLFFGIIIIGILAAIAGVILMHMNRTEYWQMKVKADRDLDQAVNEKKTAETASEDAKKKQKEAEEERDKAYVVRDQSLKDKKLSEEQAQSDKKTRQEAEESRRQAEDERDQALAAKKIAEQEKAEALEKQQIAEANAAAAELDRDKAVNSESNAVAISQSIEKEWRELKEIVERAKKIASFVSGVTLEILRYLDEAEQLTAKGWEESEKGFKNNDLKQRSYAVQILLRATRDYEAVRTKLDKLEKISPEPEQVKDIKEMLNKGIDDYIACVQITSTLLRQMITNPPTQADIKEKTELAISKKSDADKAIIDVCADLLELINENESNFPKTIKEQAEKIKKKIEQRTGTESGAFIENTSEEKMAVLPKNK